MNPLLTEILRWLKLGTSVPNFGHQMDILYFHMNNSSYHNLCEFEKKIQKFLWEHRFFEVDIVRYSAPNFGHIKIYSIRFQTSQVLKYHPQQHV